MVQLWDTRTMSFWREFVQVIWAGGACQIHRLSSFLPHPNSKSLLQTLARNIWKLGSRLPPLIWLVHKINDQ